MIVRAFHIPKQDKSFHVRLCSTVYSDPSFAAQHCFTVFCILLIVLIINPKTLAALSIILPLTIRIRLET